jgi:ketosteroid isomerase-like protein
MAGNEDIRANIDGLMAAVNTHDWGGLVEWVDPEVEYSPVEESICHRGADAFVQYFRRWYDVWDAAVAEAEEVRISSGGNRAFVVIRFAARGKGSSVPIDGRVFHVVELREGKYYRVAEFSDRDAAWSAYE